MAVTKKNHLDLIAQAFRAQERANKRKGKRRVRSLEYFVAGVPPVGLFLLYVEDLEALLKKRKGQPPAPDGLAEICLIGLAAYFEAFFKDLFAAAVNICPELLEGFIPRRDCSFTLTEVLHLVDGAKHRIGSILSEHYDWGSAQSVNGLFGDLLRVSPFSKDEAKRYAEFLNDRNLLVHHGGVYTFKYAGQKFSKKGLRRMAHWQSLTVRRSDVLRWSKFFQEIGRKTALASRKALEQFVSGSKIKLGKERERALQLLDAE